MDNKKFCFLVWVVVLLFPIIAFGAPVVLYTDITSGTNSGGENNNGCYLSIFGVGFGSSQGSSTVTIGGNAPATYKYWGTSQYGRTDIQQITIQPGSGITGSNQAIVVTVNGQSSNSNITFSVHSGNIYFIATNGTGTWNGGAGCTYDDPCNQAEGDVIDNWSSGDTLVVRGGNYNTSGLMGTGSNWIRMDDDCSSNLPCAIVGYPGESVNVDPVDSSAHCYRAYLGGAYITISGIKCTAADSWGFNTRGNNRLVNNECKDLNGSSGGAACIESAYSNQSMLGNYIHDNGGTKLYHGIYFSYSASDVEVAYNRLYNQTDQGRLLQVYTSSGSYSNFSIHDNWFRNTVTYAVTFGAPITNAKFYNNIIWSNDTTNYPTYGIRPNDASADIKIYNNTFYNTKYCYYLDSYGTLEIKNNICSEPTTAYSTGSEGLGNATVSTNIWYGAGGVPAQDSEGIGTDPKFVDKLSYDMSLSINSPAIDAGLTLGDVARDILGISRPQSVNYDIGAYEYATGTSTPSVTGVSIH